MSRKLLLGLGLLAVLFLGYFVADSLLFDGIRPRLIEGEPFQGEFYTPGNTGPQATVVILGSAGPASYYWASQFADSGWNTLALPYYRQPGLPPLMENIPLEYFEGAFRWLKQQPEAHPDKIIVMGVSRNAELALLLASTFPDLVHGVIAIAPSAVVWPNAVLPFNSDELLPSWTYQDASVPYIPMQKIEAPTAGELKTLPYWQAGLAKANAHPDAFIPVERIAGPILLLSGEDDQIWPAADMSDMIAARLDTLDFAYQISNVQYPDAGHLISRGVAYQGHRTGQMPIDGQEYAFSFGGTAEGDKVAHLDLVKRIRQFLEGF